MYNHTDIKWVKNIVPKGGEGWAYDDAGFEIPFDLQWPTKKRGSVLTAPQGEIMLLFQMPKHINGRRNYDVMLTHLVMPIDNIERTYARTGFEYGRKVLLVAKSHPINAIPNGRKFDFFLPNRGATNPFSNLVSREGLTYDQIQLRVWNLFEGHFNPYLNNSLESPNVSLPALVPQGVEEGDKKVVDHINAEISQRNSGIVKLAKALAYQKGLGRILCECCDFDFIATYGSHGDGFIECHHRIPISTGGKRITETKDLAMVCSNCHRMLHRKKDDNSYFTVEKLREKVIENKVHFKIMK